MKSHLPESEQCTTQPNHHGSTRSTKVCLELPIGDQRSPTFRDVFLQAKKTTYPPTSRHFQDDYFLAFPFRGICYSRSLGIFFFKPRFTETKLPPSTGATKNSASKLPKLHPNLPNLWRLHRTFLRWQSHRSSTAIWDDRCIWGILVL